MTDQQRVDAFIDTYDLQVEATYRLLDLQAEVGEVAKDVLSATDYGAEPARITVAADELGDVLFATLALASALDIDADAALTAALEKYEDRLDSTGTVDSGR